METVIFFATAASAIGTLIGMSVKIYKFIRQVEDKFDHYDETLKVNTRHILKLALFNPNLQINDRLHAGEEYLALGGNGEGKIKYEQLLRIREKQLSKEIKEEE